MKLEKKVAQQRDANAMKQLAIYYKKIHQDDDAYRCYMLAKKF